MYKNVLDSFITSPVWSILKPAWHRHSKNPGVFKQSPWSPHKFGISSHSFASWQVLFKIIKRVIYLVLFWNFEEHSYLSQGYIWLKQHNIYLLSTWSSVYPVLHPHFFPPSVLIQVWSHPPLSSWHSSKQVVWRCIITDYLVKLYTTR